MDDTAREVVSSALSALDLPGSIGPGYQMWVRTRPEDSPYPLIGHEIPLVIKINWTRQIFNSGGSSDQDLKAEATAATGGTGRCQFILRYVFFSSSPSRAP